MKARMTGKGNSGPSAAMSWMHVRNWKMLSAIRLIQGVNLVECFLRIIRLRCFSAVLGGIRVQSTPPSVRVSPIRRSVGPFTGRPFTRLPLLLSRSL